MLRAGVARALRKLPEEPVVVVFDRWGDDPTTDLATAVAEATDQGSGIGLHEAVDRVQHTRDVYLILDQAEEYFVYHGDEFAFDADLARLVGEPLRVNVLLSLREDALAKLDRFKPGIPAVYANSLRLDRLDRDAATAAILRPVERWNELGKEKVDVEPALVDAVLDGVRAGRIEQGVGGLGAVEGNGRLGPIEAPYLQLVMQRVWEVERAAGADVLRAETLVELGGARQVVADHLERAVEALTPAQRDVAARLFTYLVTPSGTKIAHELTDLAEYAGVAEEQAAPVVETLTGYRILRPDDTGRIEIFHDVLAGEVLAWRRRRTAESAFERERAESRRRHRRLAWVTTGALAAFVAMAFLAIFALSQRGSAQRESGRAKGRELAANAVAVLTVDPLLGVLLASEAARLAPSPEIEDVLRRSLEASRLRLVLDAGSSVNAAVYSPDDDQVVTAGADGRARLFNARSGEPEAELVHRGPVLEAWFSPDGSTVLTASDDGTARLWDAGSGSELRAFEHEGPVASARFSAAGRRVITAGADRTARIWRTADGRLVRVFQHPGPVQSAVFSPDGARVATVSERRDGRVTARVFDSRSGRQLYSPDQFGITTAGFSPDGTILVTTSSDRTARLWRAADGTLLHTFDQPDGHVVGAAFSPDGTQLVTASDGGTARVWDVATGGRLLVLVGPTNPVEGASFSPDGQFIVVSSLDRTARLYRADNGLQVTVLLGHTDGVIGATFSSDGRRVLTASLDGTARVWDPGTANQLELVGEHGVPVETASLSPDGQLAVSGDGKGSVRVWDVEARNAVRAFSLEAAVRSAAFTPDGRAIVVGGDADAARVWDVFSGKEVRSLAHPGGIRAVAFSGNGASLLTAGDRAVRIWTADGELVQEIVSGGAVLTAAIDAAGMRVAAGGGDGVARVWDVETGDLVHEISAHAGEITKISFDLEGRLLLTAGVDGKARLWNVATGSLFHDLEGHTDGVLDAEFSHDSLRVATASLDGDGGLWDVETGELMYVLRGHFNPVFAVSFDPTDRWLVTGSQRTAALWPTTSGLLAGYLRGHELPVTSAEFGLDGRRILTSSEDGTVRTWVCETCGEIDELVGLAATRLAASGRTLTDEERSRFLGD